MTHTYAFLTVSQECFDEITLKLNEAAYTHPFSEQDGQIVIDMHGIALKAEQVKDVNLEDESGSDRLRTGK